MNAWEIDWADMPDTMSFDELIAHSLFANFVQRGLAWQILLRNGVFYTSDPKDKELGRKCGPLDCVDRIFIR